MFQNVGTHTRESTHQNGDSEESFGIDLQMIFVVEVSGVCDLVQLVEEQSAGSAAHG